MLSELVKRLHSGPWEAPHRKDTVPLPFWESLFNYHHYPQKPLAVLPFL
jgi:hypothetical protein